MEKWYKYVKNHTLEYDIIQVSMEEAEVRLSCSLPVIMINANDLTDYAEVIAADCLEDAISDFQHYSDVGIQDIILGVSRSV